MLQDWDRISSSMKRHYGESAYKVALFKSLKFLRCELDERSVTKVLLQVPSVFQKELVATKILPDLVLELEKEIHSQFYIEFEVSETQVSFPVEITDKDVVTPRAVVPIIDKAMSESRQGEAFGVTLDNFVEAPFNTLALRAVKGISRNSNGGISPLVLIGPRGSGKTHLLRALYHSLLPKFGPRRITFVTGESFLSDFVSACRSHETYKFQKKYRSDTEVLVVDDISCIRSAKKTQEEFLSLLEGFELTRKKLILALPMNPSEIAGLDPAIVSRLNAGLCVTLGRPDTQSKRQILSESLRLVDLKLEEKAVVSLVENSTDDIRTIKGLVNRLNFIFNGRADTISLEEILKFIPLKRERDEFETPEEILEFISKKFGVEVKRLVSKERGGEVVKARNQAMWLMRERLGLTYAEIGRAIGFRDSSTVMNGIRSCTKKEASGYFESSKQAQAAQLI